MTITYFQLQLILNSPYIIIIQGVLQFKGLFLPSKMDFVSFSMSFCICLVQCSQIYCQCSAVQCSQLYSPFLEFKASCAKIRIDFVLSFICSKRQNDETPIILIAKRQLTTV